MASVQCIICKGEVFCWETGPYGTREAGTGSWQKTFAYLHMWFLCPLHMAFACFWISISISLHKKRALSFWRTECFMKLASQFISTATSLFADVSLTFNSFLPNHRFFFSELLCVNQFVCMSACTHFTWSDVKVCTLHESWCLCCAVCVCVFSGHTCAWCERCTCLRSPITLVRQESLHDNGCGPSSLCMPSYQAKSDHTSISSPPCLPMWLSLKPRSHMMLIILWSGLSNVKSIFSA